MQILKTMREAGIKPDVIAYTTAIKVQTFPVNSVHPVNSLLVQVAYTRCTLEGDIFYHLTSLGLRHLWIVPLIHRFAWKVRTLNKHYSYMKKLKDMIYIQIWWVPNLLWLYSLQIGGLKLLYPVIRCKLDEAALRFYSQEKQPKDEWNA